jgi:hypothetical protein
MHSLAMNGSLAAAVLDVPLEGCGTPIAGLLRGGWLDHPPWTGARGTQHFDAVSCGCIHFFTLPSPILHKTRSRFAPMARIRNVFEIIELYGHDENFEPHTSSEFVPTAAPAGSKQKIDILAERIQRGMPLWHPEDSTDSSTATLVAEEV